jgi:hypothetical protein
MTFLNHIYTRLEENSVVNNTEDFSERFLLRCPSYYRTLKAQKREACDEVLTNLISQLSAHISISKAHGTNHKFIAEWIGRCEDIEKEVADEIAARTTKRGTISTGALTSVIKALQHIEHKRSTQSKRLYH